MPLSAALQERLIKRGILNVSNINAALEANSNDDNNDVDDDDEEDDDDDDEEDEEEDNEEVFAENYDDHPSTTTTTTTTASSSQYSDVDIQIEYDECIKCPNKWNPYHTCVEYCRKRYGTKTYTPDPQVEKRRRRMLKKYPLPSNWREIPDATVDRCYYWNLDTDEVSWLPPSHPRSFLSQPAMKLRQKEMERKAEEGRRQAAGYTNKTKKKNSNNDGEKPDTDEEDLNPVQKLKRKIAGKMLSYDADPMDPSSYSDVPRGTWATGLDVKGKAKTGADETANGELYQMRPYPSPGDVLRMNADHTKKKMKH